MKAMPDNSVDSIVTDPPYELGFMGKSWDSSGIAFNIDVWREALRVIKHGGHLIAFGGSRTYHRMAVAIEDAGFEIRDQIMWVYGSGFPKSHNLKDEWQGWGTALKPAHEPMVLARKPFIGTVANNVLTHGTGGLNIDGCRVEGNKGTGNWKGVTAPDQSNNIYAGGWDGSVQGVEPITNDGTIGRWPANFIHDGLDTEWAKFFYCAKASKRDRNEGLDGFEAKEIAGKGNGLARTCASCGSSVIDGCNCPDRTFVNPSRANHHPTVKPTTLMQYLVRLVTPPNGIVLDPFMGSGSTGKACAYEGFDFIGIDQSAEYVAIAQARIDFALADK